MQNSSNILTQFNEMGICFFLGDNNLLKVTPKEKITDQVRIFIRDHKPEIIAFLSGEISESTSSKLSPSKISEDNPKLDVPSVSPELGNRLSPPQMEARRFTPRKAETISSVALDWLNDHRQALKSSGWTTLELYRRNKSKGICWCRLWDKPFLNMYLHDNGVIEFKFIDNGRDVIQTARQMPQRKSENIRKEV